MTAIDDLNATLDTLRTDIQTANGAAPATAHEIIMLRNQFNAVATLLIEAGVITAAQLETALTRQVGYDSNALVFEENALAAAAGLVGGGASGSVIPPQGIVPLSLAVARLVSGDYTGASSLNLANIGGLLASDSTPAYTLSSISPYSAGQFAIKWAAGDESTIAWSTPKPADYDSAYPVTVKFRALTNGATDTPVMHLGFYESIGDSDIGGTSEAIQAASAVLSIALASNPSDDGPWLLLFTPGSHGTDRLEMVEAWIEYTRTSERA